MTEELDDYRESMQKITRRLENAYKVLCEFETEHNEQLDDSEDKLKLFELLENVTDMLTTAQTIRSMTNEANTNKTKMNAQIQMLQDSLELLDLESKTKAVVLRKD